jgi:RHS repeat-associated protein
MLLPNLTIPACQPLASDAYPYDGTNLTGGATNQDSVGQTGSRLYELTNHLGNVMVTITDKPVATLINGTPITTAEVSTGLLAVRHANAWKVVYYRKLFKLLLWFNGKENDNEVKGPGNQIDYGMRIYDPKAGRFMSVDPLTSKYPWFTPYQFAAILQFGRPFWMDWSLIIKGTRKVRLEKPRPSILRRRN